MMHGHEKSDLVIVAMKPANKAKEAHCGSVCGGERSGVGEIAVYASRPLSPVATQHSLPSGRYSLLGPDSHRLDRASFAWRTHSITSSAAASSLSGTVRPSILAV